jgi:hypothetical protein
VEKNRMLNILGLWAVVLSAGVFIIPILSLRVAAAHGIPSATPTATIEATATVTPTRTFRAMMASDSTGTMLTRATATALPTATEIPAMIRVTFINGTEQDVCFLYISPVESDQWGPDWLGAGKVLYPGERIEIAGIEARRTDVKAEDCDHGEVWSATGIGLRDGQMVEMWEP